MPLLNDEHLMIRDVVREFATAELAPLAARLDEEHRFPSESLPKLAALELFGLTVSAEQGGAGADETSYAIALEEVARACPATAFVLLAHNTLVCRLLAQYGTDEQRRRWLRPLAKGEKLGGFGLSEPSAGTEIGAMQALATRTGAGWVLQGTKTFVPNAAAADVFVVVARTDPQGPAESSLGLFLVERGMSGVQALASETFLGLRGAGIGTLQLTDVAVEDAQVLGAPGTALARCETALDEARLGLGAVAVGIAQGAFGRALRYARERPQFGQPIAEHQMVQAHLAEMALDVAAARALVRDTCCAGLPVARRGAALAKVLATEAASRTADHAVQVHGGYGYIAEYHVERYYRDAKMCEIAYGTNEVLRLLVAQELVHGVETD